MNRNLIIPMVLLCVTCKSAPSATLKADADNSFIIRGDIGCQGYIDARNNSNSLLLLNPDGWILGYISGRNSLYTAVEDIAADYNAKQIYAKVQETCERHPDWGKWKAIREAFK